MASVQDSIGNISTYTVLAAWVVSILPHIYATQLYQKATSRSFDNRQPRNLIQIVSANQAIDSATKGRIIRAEMAQQNGFENVPLFAAAVVAANMAQLDTGSLNVLTAGYVLSRVVYNVVYINNTTGGLAMARTAVFTGGLAIIWTLFTMAGNKLRFSG